MSPIKGKVEELGDYSEFSTAFPGAESGGHHDRIGSFPSFVSDCECVYCIYFLGLGRVALS